MRKCPTNNLSLLLPCRARRVRQCPVQVPSPIQRWVSYDGSLNRSRGGRLEIPVADHDSAARVWRLIGSDGGGEIRVQW